MTARILQGNVFDMLPTIEPESVDVAITSPPYWQLRSYLPKGHALKKYELGSEPTPEKYVDNMVKVFGLVRRALAPHGVVWVNIGDTYSGSPSGNRGAHAKGQIGDGVFKRLRDRQCGESDGFSYGAIGSGIDAGNLCLIPQRLALALQADGWLVRSVVVWHKPAPMPQSVSGWRWARCRVKVKDASMRRPSAALHRPPLPLSGSGHIDASAGETATWTDCPGCPKCTQHGGYVLRRGSWRPTSSWEPILMLAKSPRYYCDGEAVKTPAAPATVSRDQYTRIIDDADEQFAVRHDHETECVSGANLRDVWTIAAEPLKAKHYAAYPSELVYKCLAASTSSKGYCPACGAPWCRVINGGVFVRDQNPTADIRVSRCSEDGRKMAQRHADNPTKTIDWRPTCNCIGADTFTPRPARVLDPFCGSGRTAIQAQRMGLDFIGCELNPEYVDMANGLIHDAAPLFAS